VNNYQKFDGILEVFFLVTNKKGVSLLGEKCFGEILIDFDGGMLLGHRVDAGREPQMQR
jgi:hypothetical protein